MRYWHFGIKQKLVNIGLLNHTTPIKKAFSILFNLLIGLFLCLVIFLNIRLYFGPHFENKAELLEDAHKQLNFLGEDIHNNDLGKHMQDIFPEGFVFTNALYGLSCAEIAANPNSGGLRKSYYLSEARFAFDEINSGYAKQNFIQSMSPEYGMYYMGWKNYLLGKIISAQNHIDSAELVLFKNNCKLISEVFNNKFYPPSYPNSSWPADAVLGIATLKQHDKLFEPQYDSLIKDWVQKVKLNLDSVTGLIPHAVDSDNGKPIEITRGSSICLTLIFLSEIDPVFAKEQFNLFFEKFTITRFGLPFIREYPKGSSGHADIDSGPVILKVGFAGTIVATGTFIKFGEIETANKISACIESIGFPKTSEDQKKYLSGKLPIADAFIVWTRLQSYENIRNNYAIGSFLMFHIYSFLLLLFFILLFYRKKLWDFLKKNPIRFIASKQK